MVDEDIYLADEDMELEAEGTQMAQHATRIWETINIPLLKIKITMARNGNS